MTEQQALCWPAAVAIVAVCAAFASAVWAFMWFGVRAIREFESRNADLRARIARGCRQTPPEGGQ